MPLLHADDPLPSRPSRVVVNGTSGAGKSTLARRIGALLGLPYTELDSLFHGPGWTSDPDFLEAVESLVSAPSWVCEYQYDAARPLLAERADLVVWLDTPTTVAMGRVVRRTVTRRLRREVLWNGNQEGPLRAVLTDPEHIVRWAWATRHTAEERVRELLVERPDLPVVHLRTRREVEHWLRGPLSDSRPTRG